MIDGTVSNYVWRRFSATKTPPRPSARSSIDFPFSSSLCTTHTIVLHGATPLWKTSWNVVVFCVRLVVGALKGARPLFYTQAKFMTLKSRAHEMELWMGKCRKGGEDREGRASQRAKQYAMYSSKHCKKGKRRKSGVEGEWLLKTKRRAST